MPVSTTPSQASTGGLALTFLKHRYKLNTMQWRYVVSGNSALVYYKNSAMKTVKMV